MPGSGLAKDHPIVGVIGGMGPDATVDLMQRVIRATPAKDDADHIHLLVDNNPKVPSRIAALVEGHGESPVPVLLHMAKQLERAGAEILVIPCNTAHAYLKPIRNAVTVPVMDMVQMTAERLSELPSAPGCVGIIASTAVLKTRLYDSALGCYGLDLVLPSPADQETVMSLIKKVKSADVSKGDGERLRNIAEALVEARAEAIVVACTDLSVISRDTLTKAIPFVDALDVLVDGIVTYVQQAAGADMPESAAAVP